ncbi:hypothetical protein EPIR_2001 [Erwinia piriflorinigrans CFBP 5888]|uniref:Uncharacterized protein n=1 Tax=Erwinia piriflorinigrans CFBP 5888 TaxID=1161919 RepID=V5Z8K8_9GAMM|nr:hypothetical protein EPIR_2001 [Erwinia piriflorinigrans CFBP 5888]
MRQFFIGSHTSGMLKYATTAFDFALALYFISKNGE